ncbi:MAG: ABC transporter permease [Hyphomicrobiales bacterium]|nr:ABC transporter permease [Hyphomicrobiales bacterium]
MWTQSFFPAIARAVSQWRLAWLFAAANLTEARRVNKIALTTPFLSVLLQVGFLGLVYGALFGADIKHYIPYLAVSLALWHSISVFVTNAVGYNDIANRHLNFTTLSPYTIHLSGLIETILLLLAKMLAACLVVIAIEQGVPAWTNLLMTVIGMIVLALFMFFLGILVAYVFDWFRFLRALLPQLLFLAFLITPVIWQKEQLQRIAWLADFNPLAHVLEIVRAPLLGESLPWTSLGIVIAMTGLMAVLGILVHRANRTLVLFRWVA